MKTSIALVALVMIGLVSCEETGDLEPGDIEGVYEGTFTISSSLKALPFVGEDMHHGTAEVQIMENNQIEVHCYGELVDSTFMLDYYEHNDSVMVCLTGKDFEHLYGHMLGHGHMGGGMMDDISDHETEWMHHLNDEHQEGDEHFGGFNLHDMTFTYAFIMMDGNTPYYLSFHGVKQ